MAVMWHFGGVNMRYNFSLFRKQVWKDLFTKPKYLWGMWGFAKTFSFIVKDTFNHIIKYGVGRKKNDT